MLRNIIKNLLLEEDLTLHISNKEEIFDVDSDYKPYYSENIVRMDSGRDTGHFGSGTYFSTYNESKQISELLTDYTYNNHTPKPTKENPVIKIKNNIIVTDLDLYKLYKPSGYEHADLLFKTLKKINSLGSIYNNDKISYSDNYIKDKLIEIDTNLKILKLKRPKMTTIARIINSLSKSYSENSKLGSYPTLATSFMEYNGYNGVNVNNITGFDNTLHGSVVYDLRKTVSDSIKSPRVDIWDTKYIENKIKKLVKNANSNGYLHLNKSLSIKDINLIFNLLTKFVSIFNFNYSLENDEITEEQYNHILKIYPKYFFRILQDDIEIKLDRYTLNYFIEKGTIQKLLDSNKLNNYLIENDKVIKYLIDNNLIDKYILNEDYVTDIIYTEKGFKYMLDNNLITKIYNMDYMQGSVIEYTVYKYGRLDNTQKTKIKDFFNNIDRTKLTNYQLKQVDELLNK